MAAARARGDRPRARDYVRRLSSTRRTMNLKPFQRHVRSIGAAILGVAAASATSAAQKALPPLKVIDPSYMDKSVSACVDFFAFANGTWFKHDTIPSAYSSSGVGRDMSD